MPRTAALAARQRDSDPATPRHPQRRAACGRAACGRAARRWRPASWGEYRPGDGQLGPADDGEMIVVAEIYGRGLVLLDRVVTIPTQHVLANAAEVPSVKALQPSGPIQGAPACGVRESKKIVLFLSMGTILSLSLFLVQPRSLPPLSPCTHDEPDTPTLGAPRWETMPRRSRRTGEFLIQISIPRL